MSGSPTIKTLGILFLRPMESALVSRFSITVSHGVYLTDFTLTESNPLESILLDSIRWIYPLGIYPHGRYPLGIYPTSDTILSRDDRG